jgi:hypothetical protein
VDEEPATEPEAPSETLDDPQAALVRRLARPHPSGGLVIERAAIMAAGSGSSAVLDWITEHGGKPEEAVAAPGVGLHGGRDRPPPPGGDTPLRYVIPAGALGPDS